MKIDQLAIEWKGTERASSTLLRLIAAQELRGQMED